MKQQYCECGCGELAKLGNRFIHGHNGRNNPDRARKISSTLKRKIKNGEIIPWSLGETAKTHPQMKYFEVY